MPDHNIDDFFKKGIEGFEPSPPDKVWAEIEKAIPAKQSPNYTGLLLLLFALVFVGTTAYLLYALSSTRNELEMVTQHIADSKDAETPSTEVGKQDTSTAKGDFAARPLAESGTSGAGSPESAQTEAKSSFLGSSSALPNEQVKPAMTVDDGVSAEPMKVRSSKPTSPAFKENQGSDDLRDPAKRADIEAPGMSKSEIEPAKGIDQFEMSPMALLDVGNTAAVQPNLLDRAPVAYYSPNPNRWMIGAYHIASFNYRRVNGRSPTGDELVDLLNEAELAASGHGAGLSFAYENNRKWRFTGALEYLSRTQNASYSIGFEEVDITGTPDPNTGSGWSLGELVNSSFGTIAIEVTGLPDEFNSQSLAVGSYRADLNTRRTMEIVRIPITAEYLIQRGRWTLGIGGGVAYNRVTKDETSFTLRDLGEETQIQKNSLVGNYLSLQGSLAVEWGISERLKLRLNPSYESWLTPIYSDENIRTLPFSYGIRTGMVYDLGRL